MATLNITFLNKLFGFKHFQLNCFCLNSKVNKGRVNLKLQHNLKLKLQTTLIHSSLRLEKNFS